MGQLLRTFQYAIIAGVLAGGLFVLEQLAGKHMPTDPYAPPRNQSVAVGEWPGSVKRHVTQFEQQVVIDLSAFWRYGAE